MTMHYPPVIHVEASCDWLTRTFSDDKIRRIVYDDVSTTIGAWMHQGHESTVWQWMGFSGVSCHGLSWGQRHDCDILRLSGSTAELLFTRFAPHPGNCSRLDVAVTIAHKRPIGGVAAKWYQERAVLNEPADNRTYSLIVNSKGGETMYVGSRLSDQFGRIYDKNAEEGIGEVGQRWRYEVEFKGDRAKSALSRLTSVTQRDKMYIALVKGFFEHRAIKLPEFSPEVGIDIPLPVETKSADKQLAWLKRQVAGVVERLIASGLEDEVRRALRLER